MGSFSHKSMTAVFIINLMLCISLFFNYAEGVSDTNKVDDTSQTPKYIFQRNESDLDTNLTGPKKLGGHILAISLEGSQPIVIRRVSKNVFDADKSYTAGRFAIQIDGENIGYFASRVDTFLSGRQTPITGNIYLLGRDRTANKITEFNDALITEFKLPVMDADSGSTQQRYFQLELETAKLIKSQPKQLQVNFRKSTKKWLPSAFELELGDLPCEKVSKIDSFTIKQNIVKGDISRPKYEDITLEIGMGMGRYKAWKAMSKKPFAEQKKLLNGLLVIKSSDSKIKFARLLIRGAHIVSLHRGENSFEARISVSTLQLK